MNLEEQLNILAERARNERAPQVDVTLKVLSILSRQHNAGVFSESPLKWLAAISSAIAASAAVLAVISYQNWPNAISEVSQAISWVTK
jgi:hypothetical protein